MFTAAKSRRFRSASLALAVALVVSSAVAQSRRKRYEPAIDPAKFTHFINNPYFPLVPGVATTFLEKERRETRVSRIVVTRELKTILGVKCRKVRDTVTLDGVLLEETIEWYAQDEAGSVWLFGEATREYKSGGRVSTEGSWEAGVEGAQPGIVMPGRPTVGTRYRHCFSANTAEDIGQVAALGESVTVPLGVFPDCIRTREWSMLESSTSYVWYARGIGQVRSECTDGEVTVLISRTGEE